MARTYHYITGRQYYSREARNLRHGVSVHLMGSSDDGHNGSVSVGVYRKNGRTEWATATFDWSDLDGADAYFEHICSRLCAVSGEECPTCKGSGMVEYQEDYGLNGAERWGMYATLTDDCRACEGTGWAPEGRPVSFGDIINPEATYEAPF